MGIPEESIGRIFERFYRVDKSHSKEIGGTGLGLAITRSAVTMHHGTIQVASKEGEGTTFTVKQYDTIFYRAGSDNDPVQGFVIARCKKQIENESTQYAFVNATPSATTPDTTYGGDFKKFIHLSLTISDIQQDLNPNYPDTRFVFGYAHDKEIYSLEVEGQKPDGIIEYEEYGRTMYMWYYNDLESNKRGDCLSYSVDVPE